MKPTVVLSSSFVVSLTCTFNAILCLLFSSLISVSAIAQDTFALHTNNIAGVSSASSISYPYNKKRVKLVAAGNILAYTVGMAGLYSAWYKDYPQSRFHTFNDIDEWKGIDKMGHVYSAYAESKASMELWRWTGVSRKKRIWLGGMSGAAYQTVIEILDGFSSEWGWSWGDFGANMLGSGLLVSQELAWDEQRIQMKWSFHRKNYKDAGLNQRSNDIFGNGNAERFLKDYNGQTYWLSTSIKSFFPNSNCPAWLQISLGTGAEGLYGARNNYALDKMGNEIFNRQDLPRYRQWYIAPDIDLTKIKTNKKALKVALNVFNIIKFPTPSLEYSRGKFSWNWIHF
ncbi:MAG: DUF2279 domain-containing protein [Ferruginibacter sp.]